MVKDGQLGEQDGKLVAIKDPSLDDLEEPETFDNNIKDDDLEGLRTDIESGEGDDYNTDSSISSEIDPELAKDLGIDSNDPWGEKGMLDDNYDDYND